MKENDVSRRCSNIGQHSKNDFSYAMQFKEAFYILYDSNHPVNLISMPMLFSLRHYLELILKYNINYFCEYSKLNSKVRNKKHQLKPLANAFQEHWNIIQKEFDIKSKDDKEYFQTLHILVDNLERLDEKSISFRYAKNFKDEENFSDPSQRVNIKALKDMLERITPLLENSIDFFEVH